MATAAQNKELIDKHDEWLKDHEERIRDLQITQGKQITRMALIAAFSAALMSGVFSLIVGYILISLK